MPTEIAKLGKLALWEYGRKKLGYGDYVEDRDGPYQKWAGMQSHRLFMVMRKRKVSNEDFALCVDYCHALRMRIENAVWVLKFIGEARAWRRSQSAPSQTAATVDDAIAYEQALAAEDSPTWIARLTRARGHFREEVIAQWQQHRQTA